jgi:hypothetical protein
MNAWASGAAASFVIQISVDGLRPSDLQALIDAGEVPSFERLQVEGAGTGNARVDQTPSLPPIFGFEKLVQTLPNHASMMTGRPIQRNNDLGDEVGHGYTSNDDPLPGETIHNFQGSDAYKASVFDVAHDHGLQTGLFASKGKFDLFEQSWSDGGEPDDKIDVYVNISNAMALTETLIAALQTDPIDYVFLHYRDPDSVGHEFNWGSPEYLDAICAIDDALGLLFEFIDNDAAYAGSTALILTADHGGGHWLPDSHVRYDYLLDARIPFYVWGPGVTAGADLYELNDGIRFDPGDTEEIGLTDPQQPLRDGDGGNLALDLLGLPPIPGSVYNIDQAIIVGDGVACAADVDGSGEVDVLDLVALVSAWGSGAGPADIDGDGQVGVSDLVELVLSWGSCS